jgi:nucleoporin POM152
MLSCSGGEQKLWVRVVIEARLKFGASNKSASPHLTTVLPVQNTKPNNRLSTSQNAMSRHLDSTPRPGPADFPVTPQTSAQQARQRLSAAIKRQARTPVAASSKQDPDAPIIPLNVLDAPSQRLFAFGIYGLLQAWKLMDYWSTSGFHETESFWLFMKWVLFDAVFFMSLVSFKIPWLSWAPATMILIIFSHAVFDAVMMFQVGLPLSFWFEALVKLFYEREMAISERRVKPQSVMDHSSLIMGKQVINILPEGSALLNPHNEHFCIGGNVNQVQLPIQINQTQPILIEILRRDFDMTSEEVLSIKSSEAKKLRRAAADYHKRTKGPQSSQDPLVLRYTVRKPGQYTIQKIVDESKLDVRPRPSEILVVECPSARIKLESGDRCKGELSDVSFEVNGTPPLKIKYRKLVNGNPTESQFQSIQPDDFISPLSKRHQSALSKGGNTDFSWAKSQTITVPINETMTILGKYSYTIDEVQDAYGNKMVYSTSLEDDEINRSKHPEISQSISVHDRPLIWIPKKAGCNSERPLKVASGREAELPHRIASVGRTESEVEYRNDYVFDEDHIIEYDFIPEDQIHVDPSAKKIKMVRVKKSQPSAVIPIKEPGLYALKGIWTGHCRGEVSEPSACLLENPIKPSVQFDSSEITHKCANSPIGLRVNFEFQGSPPFTVRYLEDKDGSKKFQRSRTFDGYRGQIELVPNDAGHYRYTFNEISDNYYNAIRLNEVLHQDVRPSASAHIAAESAATVQNICIGQPASFTVYMLGDAPWTLEYEVIHGKSRRKVTKTDIVDHVYRLEIDDIKEGGEYTLSLSSVSDRSGCKEFLKGEAKFHVWSQVPTAGFGLVNGKRSAQILEGKAISLPLKFTGQPSFGYTLKNNETGAVYTDAIDHANGAFQVKSPGTYVIMQMKDRYCPGIVDSTAESFVINWISRPTLSLSQHSTVQLKGSKYVKQEVCEGDEDFLELALQGKLSVARYGEEHTDGFRFSSI